MQTRLHFNSQMTLYHIQTILHLKHTVYNAYMFLDTKKIVFSIISAPTCLQLSQSQLSILCVCPTASIDCGKFK